jgi:hypothetical protein
LGTGLKNSQDLESTNLLKVWVVNKYLADNHYCDYESEVILCDCESVAKETYNDACQEFYQRLYDHKYVETCCVEKLDNQTELHDPGYMVRARVSITQQEVNTSQSMETRKRKENQMREFRIIGNLEVAVHAEGDDNDNLSICYGDWLNAMGYKAEDSVICSEDNSDEIIESMRTEYDEFCFENELFQN